MEKEKNTNQEVAPDAAKPPAAIQDPPTEKETSKTVEIILATLSLSAKADLASKGPEASEVAFTQPIHGLPKDKTVIKKKCYRSFFYYYYYFFFLQFVINMTSLYLICLFLWLLLMKVMNIFLISIILIQVLIQLLSCLTFR